MDIFLQKCQRWELIINLIDRIEIFEDKNINIKVSFNNFK